MAHPPTADNSDDVVRKLLSSRNVLSDRVAKHPKLHDDVVSMEESDRRFKRLTLRTIRLIDGSPAFARGYWPREAGDKYMYPPASDPMFPGDETSFNPNEYGLARNNSAMVPLVIAWVDVQLSPIPNPATRIPKVLLGPDGQPDLGVNGELLREFPLLPRYISSAVEGWRMHYWFTMDKRINYHDIISRMRYKCSADGGEGPLVAGIFLFTKELTARVDKFRRDHGILAPLTKIFDYENYEVTGSDVQAINNLSMTQLAYGTWWTVDEEIGVMYPPKPKDGITPWKLEQYLLPEKTGISLRVQAILEYCMPKIPQQMPTTAQTAPRRRAVTTPQVPVTTPQVPVTMPQVPVTNGLSEPQLLQQQPFENLVNTNATFAQNPNVNIGVNDELLQQQAFDNLMNNIAPFAQNPNVNVGVNAELLQQQAFDNFMINNVPFAQNPNVNIGPNAGLPFSFDTQSSTQLANVQNQPSPKTTTSKKRSTSDTSNVTSSKRSRTNSQSPQTEIVNSQSPQTDIAQMQMFSFEGMPSVENNGMMVQGFNFTPPSAIDGIGSRRQAEALQKHMSSASPRQKK